MVGMIRLVTEDVNQLCANKYIAFFFLRIERDTRDVMIESKLNILE